MWKQTTPGGNTAFIGQKLLFGWIIGGQKFGDKDHYWYKNYTYNKKNAEGKIIYNKLFLHICRVLQLQAGYILYINNNNLKEY